MALLNAPGNGVADDKGIYYFVPKMIRYYLGEEPVLQNAPTYLPFYEEDMKYVLEHFDDLVLKDVAEAGGYGVVFGNSMTKQQKEDFITLLKKNPAALLHRRSLIFWILILWREIPSFHERQTSELLYFRERIRWSGRAGLQDFPETRIPLL